jgi:hypothetical protein
MPVNYIPQGTFKDLILILIVAAIIVIIGLSLCFAVIRIIFYPTLIKPTYHFLHMKYDEYKINKVKNGSNT